MPSRPPQRSQARAGLLIYINAAAAGLPHSNCLQESWRTAMWTRTIMRLLSLSFISFFVIGLLWEEARRQSAPAGRKSAAAARKDGTAAPSAID
jgi:hypothetical protein